MGLPYYVLNHGPLFSPDIFFGFFVRGGWHGRELCPGGLCLEGFCQGGGYVLLLIILSLYFSDI